MHPCVTFNMCASCERLSPPVCVVVVLCALPLPITQVLFKLLELWGCVFVVFVIRFQNDVSFGFAWARNTNKQHTGRGGGGGIGRDDTVLSKHEPVITLYHYTLRYSLLNILCGVWQYPNATCAR